MVLTRNAIGARRKHGEFMPPPSTTCPRAHHGGPSAVWYTSAWGSISMTYRKSPSHSVSAPSSSGVGRSDRVRAAGVGKEVSGGTSAMHAMSLRETGGAGAAPTETEGPRGWTGRRKRRNRRLRRLLDDEREPTRRLAHRLRHHHHHRGWCGIERGGSTEQVTGRM